ncbi:heme peroxidase family protein [Microbacterium sp. ZW T2_14]|uniref:peroxidase family protein n=1 Tax=Microbacterium sp. ZW T2_14 TaxID=3378079 RepID=UPI003854ECF0
MSTDTTTPGAKSPGDAFAAQPFLREQLGLNGTRERSPGERQAPRLPVDIRGSLEAVRPEHGRFHGAKFSLGYFPAHEVFSSAADKFGYLTKPKVRAASRLPVDDATRALLTQLGDLMANSGRETADDSATPSGYTYVGQFVDHDITLDVSSALDAPELVDAAVINNMRSPMLDLDSVYGRGPAVDAFLYAAPAPGEPASAFRMLLGTNLQSGPGGAGGAAGGNGIIAHTDFDVPRTSALTAIIGDPRNNENLIVSQLHHTMLRFHNAIVDALIASGFTGDIFVAAKREATLHYQWAVLHDFLPRICGQAAVDDAVANVKAKPNSPFQMPVEFSVAAYRFGHSMIRDQYWLNFELRNKPMSDVFKFIHEPHLPVRSNWVVDFNAFFETGFAVPVFNNARKIDSVLASALEDLDGSGSNALMSILATRNLHRGLVLGLPSGQATAAALGVPVLTTAQLTDGLPADEIAVLQQQNGLLLEKTPLWYYVLREAMVTSAGEHLGPLGAKIVADTFVTLLRRDALSILNVAFSPTRGATPGAFTFADLVRIADVIGA